MQFAQCITEYNCQFSIVRQNSKDICLLKLKFVFKKLKAAKVKFSESVSNVILIYMYKVRNHHPEKLLDFINIYLGRRRLQSAT